jgi:hypothetical protein
MQEGPELELRDGENENKKTQHVRQCADDGRIAKGWIGASKRKFVKTDEKNFSQQQRSEGDYGCVEQCASPSPELGVKRENDCYDRWKNESH